MTEVCTHVGFELLNLLEQLQGLLGVDVAVGILLATSRLLGQDGGADFQLPGHGTCKGDEKQIRI